MTKESVIIVFRNKKRNIDVDIEIPLYITANELVIALNSAYELGIDISDIKQCYLKSENPLALLKGNRRLNEFGIKSGTIIYYAE